MGGILCKGSSAWRGEPREWTFDVDRSRAEAILGYFLISVLTLGGFFLAAPLVAALLWRLGPFRPGLDELLVLCVTVLLVAVSARVHRSEVSLSSLRRDLERDGQRMTPEALAGAVEVISRMSQASGAMGHVGGIGAPDGGTA